MAKRPNPTKAQRNRQSKPSKQLGGGEIVTWNCRPSRGGKLPTRADVLSALGAEGLDVAMAKDILPRHAFNRAMKQLAQERVLDMLRETGDEIHFQLTSKLFRADADEWRYAKECVLILNKASGAVSCDANPGFAKIAHDRVLRCIEERTTSDITRIVQRLFENQLGLFPIRENGGAYFVPAELREFNDKIEGLLTRLGGRLDRFILDASSERGAQSVAHVVATSIMSLVEEHRSAVRDFSTHTRQDTIERVAARIKETRVKLEAYNHYLQEQSGTLADVLLQTDQELQARVAEIAQQRANAPATSEDGSRTLLLGFAVTAVIRWMGANQWRPAECRKVLEHFGIDVADATISTSLGNGRRGLRLASLSPEQIEELEAVKENREPKKKAKRGGKKSA